MVTVGDQAQVASSGDRLGQGVGSSFQVARSVQIAPPNFQVARFVIEGITPYVQHKFSAKARAQIRATQEAGATAKSRKKREARDFGSDYEAAQHRTADGERGIPAPAFRNAMIAACRTAGFVMTKAKLAVFILADGLDAEDQGGLVFFTKGEPHAFEGYVRNETGVVDLRSRPMWDVGWRAEVRVRFDADMLTLEDVANLLNRAGQQVGIGEGRPSSPNSNGLDWGLFRLVEEVG